MAHLSEASACTMNFSRAYRPGRPWAASDTTFRRKPRRLSAEAEFSFEREVENVREAVEAMRVEYPIALDSDYVQHPGASSTCE